MVDRPILFSAPMVRALLDGRKTQTRRIMNIDKFAEYLAAYDSSGAVKEYLPGRLGMEYVHRELGLWNAETNPGGRSAWYVPIRFTVGDRLWVKETAWICPPMWTDSPVNPMGPQRQEVAYVADDLSGYTSDAAQDYNLKKTPSIFMPRWASRLTLTVTDVRVERLQDISRADAIAEGLALASNVLEEFWRWPKPHHENLWLSPPAAYRHLWNAINGKDAWDANPFVVAVSFEVHKCNIDQMGESQCPTVTASSPS